MTDLKELSKETFITGDKVSIDNSQRFDVPPSKIVLQVSSGETEEQKAACRLFAERIFPGLDVEIEVVESTDEPQV